jgi:hypothetical protein
MPGCVLKCELRLKVSLGCALKLEKEGERRKGEERAEKILATEFYNEGVKKVRPG